MNIKVIHTESEYDEAVNRVYELLQSSEDPISPKSQTGEEIELLSFLIEKYEHENYYLPPPDPIEAIKFRMDQMKLKQKDISLLFGGKTRTSEVLNRKRPLTLKMIYLVHKNLDIPLESLINSSVKFRELKNINLTSL